MPDRVIKLKRNILLLQLQIFFPLIIIFGIAGAMAGATGFNNLDNTVWAAGFLIEIIMAIRISISNKNSIKFSGKEIEILKPAGTSCSVIKSFPLKDIDKVIANDNNLSIKLLLYGGREVCLLKFKYTNTAGEDIYFRIKSELCRYLPAKTVSLRDKYVTEYLDNNTYPEYIQTRQQIGISTGKVILFFEFLFAIIPIGRTIYAVYWAFGQLAVLFSNISVWFLNLIRI